MCSISRRFFYQHRIYPGRRSRCTSDRSGTGEIHFVKASGTWLTGWSGDLGLLRRIARVPFMVPRFFDRAAPPRHTALNLFRFHTTFEKEGKSINEKCNSSDRRRGTPEDHQPSTSRASYPSGRFTLSSNCQQAFQYLQLPPLRWRPAHAASLRRVPPLRRVRGLRFPYRSEVDKQSCLKVKGIRLSLIYYPQYIIRAPGLAVSTLSGFHAGRVPRPKAYSPKMRKSERSLSN